MKREGAEQLNQRVAAPPHQFGVEPSGHNIKSRLRATRQKARLSAVSSRGTEPSIRELVRFADACLLLVSRPPRSREIASTRLQLPALSLQCARRARLPCAPLLPPGTSRPASIDPPYLPKRTRHASTPLGRLATWFDPPLDGTQRRALRIFLVPSCDLAAPLSSRMLKYEFTASFPDLDPIRVIVRHHRPRPLLHNVECGPIPRFCSQ